MPPDQCVFPIQWYTPKLNYMFSIAKWKERQPQTEEERAKEENEWFKLIYKQTVSIDRLQPSRHQRASNAASRRRPSIH